LKCLFAFIEFYNTFFGVAFSKDFYPLGRKFFATMQRQQKQLRLAFKGAGREADRLQFHMAELELIMKHMKDSLERKFQLDQEGTRVKRLIDRRSRNFLGSKAADKPATRGKDSDLEGLR
uniref:SPX domain-containing protein n=2 Tax=Macrostomum lignano TaxID=282301 RepID=A0A1I8HBD7_9PLAT